MVAKKPTFNLPEIAADPVEAPNVYNLDVTVPEVTPTEVNYEFVQNLADCLHNLDQDNFEKAAGIARDDIDTFKQYWNHYTFC